MSRINFSLDFGDGFSVSQHQPLTNKDPRMTGAFHRLTPEQFDALTDAFDLDNGFNHEEKIDTLTVPDTGRKFRSASINFGGLIVGLYSDVAVEAEVPA